MLTTALMLTVGLSNQQSNPLEFQSLTGQPVENLFPKLDMPASTVSVGGLTFALKDENTVGAYLPSSNAASMWEGIQSTPNPTISTGNPKIRIKIMLFSEVLMMDHTSRGWMSKRSNFSFFDREEITRAMAQFDLVLRRSGLDPYIQFNEDDDIIVVANEPGKSENIYDVVSKIMAPRANDDLFESDDPTYRGPFDIIFALHAGLSDRIEVGTLGHTPLAVVPLLGATQHKLDVDLSTHLLKMVSNQIQYRRFPLPANRLSWQVPFTTVASLPSIDPSLSAPVPADGRARPESVKFLDAADPIGALSADTTMAVWANDSETKVAATGMGWMVANQLTSPFTQSSVAADNTGRIWLVGTISGRHMLADLISGTVKMAPVTEQPAPITGALPLNPQPFGSFVWQLNDKNERTGNITQTAARTNGGIRLISRQSRPVISNPPATTLSLKLRLKSVEAYALNFFGQNHEYLGSVQISGNRTDEKNVLAARQPLTGELQTFTFKLTNIQQPIYAIEFGPTQQMTLAVRRSPEPAVFLIDSLSFADEAALTLDSPTEYELFDRNVSQEALVKTQDFSNVLIAIAAAGQLADNAKPENIAMYAEMSRSGREPIAFFGCRALKKLNSPASLAELRITLQQGPFDTNRRFAAEAITQPLPDDWLTDVNFCMASRSWQTRYYAAQLFKLNSSPRSQIFLVSSLQDPVSNVRAQIAADLDANVSLSARRLLFLAVNDSSEQVRAVSYARLLESKDAAILDEALRGIRDDSRTVKLTILNKIETMPDEKFRGALRIGVLDRSPEIQAAVLTAFQKMPEAVSFNEISNTVGSQSEAVQLALLRLAESKSIALPKPELDRLAQSRNATISGIAKRLGGGS